MNARERFHAIMGYQESDRLPCWYFGTWRETRERWLSEGLHEADDVATATGMDPDWETGMWDVHGMVNVGTISREPRQVLEETDTDRVVRTSLGAVHKESKLGSSIPHHIEEALKPTRQSWDRFKRFIDPADPARRPADWQAKAEEIKHATHRVFPFNAGSLFAMPREWLGVEAVSYLAYDDPVLYEEIIECVADYFMALLGPVLDRVTLDFGYYFEDCCFNTGPLISPEIYRRFYDRHYRRMIEFYRSKGVRFILLDSDGKVDALIPCWLDSGIDIVFPIEVGTWRASPADLRRRFGRRLRMMGGVDKHVIPRGEKAIREHLAALAPVVEDGGFIPLPDHRIPPDCSLDQFRTYVSVFKEVFA
jgi:hypothetical protein